MVYVIKVKYGDILRRFTLESKLRAEELSFPVVENKIRRLFDIPVEKQIRVTYNDGDNDVITMADDQDLVDALIMQSLNPLRLHVTLIEPKSTPAIPATPAETTTPRSDSLRLDGPSGPKKIRTFKEVVDESLLCPIATSCTIYPLSEAAKFYEAARKSPAATVPVTSVETTTPWSTAGWSELLPLGLRSDSETFRVMTRKEFKAAHQKRVDETLLTGTPPATSCKISDAKSQILHEVGNSMAATDSSPQFSEFGETTNLLTRHVPASVKIQEDVKYRPVSEDVPVSSPHKLRASANALESRIARMVDLPRRGAEVSTSPVKNEGMEGSEVKSVARVFHTGVQCDGCGMSPIAGPRFKSTKKHDYDLCRNCFEDADDQASYTRIDRPLYRPRHLHPGSGRMRCPAMDSNYHQGRHMSMSGPYCSRPAGRWGPVHPMNGAVYGGKLDSRFVEDVTIMDGTEMAPGTPFTKIWRLRNSGKIPWAPQTKLVHVGGDELGNVFVVPLELPEHGLLPDQEVEAAVDLVAPEKAGRYVSHWRLASPAGPKFGHRVWVVIQVVTKENVFFNTPASEIRENDADKSQERVAEESPLRAGSLTYESREAFVKASHELVKPEADLANRLADITEPFSGLEMSDTVKDAELRIGDSPVNDVVKVAELTGDDSPVDDVVKLAELRDENSPVAVGGDKVVPTENVVLDEAAVVESSELGGGFSMVEMPSSKQTYDSVYDSKDGSQVNSVSSTPREEVEVSRGNKQELEVDVGEGDNVEDSNNPELLSVKLAAMGFSDRKLNIELLVKNKLDLRRTLDDLFAAAEWDPILEELEEMGFYDTEMNRRLMFKNNGSVKRVVKELVQMYKEPAGQGNAKTTGL